MRTIIIALAAATLLPMMSGCSQNASDGAATGQTSSRSGTLSQQLAGSAGHARVARALDETGLAGIFAGKDSYTLFAPDDDSLARLEAGSKEGKLDGEQARAALAALLREHIVPGTITTRDIGAAIDKAGNGKVEMRTMGEGEIVFSRKDKAIIATTADGATATLGADAVTAGASAAIPIAGVLKKG